MNGGVMMRKGISILTAFVLLLLFCCGCGEDENVIKGAGHSFSYTLVGNPDTLDPQLAVNASAQTVLCNLFEGLLVTGADGSIRNGVAESYEISEDRKHYTFHLRENNYWYQAIGENVSFDADAKMNVTAEDFVFAFQRLFDPVYHSANAEAFACISNARDIMKGIISPEKIGVHAADRFTLEFTLDFPIIDPFSKFEDADNENEYDKSFSIEGFIRGCFQQSKPSIWSKEPSRILITTRN